MPAGHHVSTWDGTNHAGASVAGGTFFVIDAVGHHEQQKGVLLK